MKHLIIPFISVGLACATGYAVGTVDNSLKEPAVVEPEREPFHGSFVCEYYGAKTSKIDNVVGYDVFDVGNNFGWNLTLADGAHMMYLQSADKFCYTVASNVIPEA